MLTQQESMQEIEPEMENELPAAGAWNGRSLVEAMRSTILELIHFLRRRKGGKGAMIVKDRLRKNIW